MDDNKLITEYIDELKDQRFLRLSKYFIDIKIKEMKNLQNCKGTLVDKYKIFADLPHPEDKLLMRLFLNSHFYSTLANKPTPS